MEWSSLVRQIAKLLEVLTSSIGGVACLRFGAGMLVLLQGAAAGYWCQNAVCAMKLGGGCGMSMAVCAWASPKNIFCYLGPMRYRHTHTQIHSGNKTWYLALQMEVYSLENQL